MSQLTGRVST